MQDLDFVLQTIKYVLIIGFSLLICLFCTPEVRPYFSFRAQSEDLEKRFVEAIRSDDLDRAEKILEKYDACKSAYDAKMGFDKQIRDDDRLSDFYGRRFLMSPHMHSILCERKKDWDGAIRSIDEAARISLAEYGGLKQNVWRDKQTYGLMPSRVRIHYKMGDYASAFVDFCKLAPSPIPERAPLNAYLSRCIRDCFPTYDDFLRFMETQFLKLGRPEEYREAMDVYRQRSTANAQTLDPASRSRAVDASSIALVACRMANA